MALKIILMNLWGLKKKFEKRLKNILGRNFFGKPSQKRNSLYLALNLSTSFCRHFSEQCFKREVVFTFCEKLF